MDKNIIAHVFAAVQSLEKSLTKVKELLPEAGDSRAEVEKLIPQQEDTILKMRRTANRLQLEFAREDWGSVVRSLKIFYGLNHLIRRDLLKTQSRLAGTTSKYLVSENVGEAKEVQYH